LHLLYKLRLAFQGDSIEYLYLISAVAVARVLQTITFEYYHTEFISSTVLILILDMLYHISENGRQKYFEGAKKEQEECMGLFQVNLRIIG